MVQLSYPYMTIGNFNYTDIFQQVVSLLLNMLSRFVIVFLPMSKCLLILWLQALSEVNLEPKKIKAVTVSIISPSSCHEVMGLDALDSLVVQPVKNLPAMQET